MYTVRKHQDAAGHFELIDTAETLEDAIASAKCHVDGNERAIAYVFCDQTYMGKTYPYLVTKVFCVREYNGGLNVVVGMA